MTDERENKPSASSFDRYVHCPGSWALSKHAPPQDESDDAAFGTAVHDYIEHLANAKAIATTEAVVECAERCLGIEREAQGNIGVERIAFQSREERLWSEGRSFSGKADRAVAFIDDAGETCFWIHDHKTGRGKVDTAATNWQLRALAALAVMNYPEIQRCYVSVGGPYQDPKLTIAIYNRSDLELAASDCEIVVANLKDPHAPRNPGNHCQFCPAKESICPEQQGVASALPIRLAGALSVATKENMAVAAQKLSNDDLGALMAQYRVREWANKAIYDEAKRRIQAGESVHGCKLVPGDTREKINDTMALFGRIQDLTTPEEFCKFTSITKKSLTDLLKSKGLKGKELTDKIKTVLDGITTKTECAPSLEVE